MGISSGLKGNLYLKRFFLTNIIAAVIGSAAAANSCGQLLHVQTINTFNLILKDQREVEHYGTGKKPKKDWQLRGMAETINRFKPDVLVMQELENEEQTLSWKNNYFEDDYEFKSSGHTDDRGVLTGFLVRKALLSTYDFEVESHKDEVWSAPEIGVIKEPLFRRDLPVLWATHKDGEKKGQRAFAVIGVHLKSKRSYKGDFQSTRLRAEQVTRMIQIADTIQMSQPAGFPLMIAGDFNEDILKESAGKALLQSGYVDTVVSVSKNPTDAELITFSYMHKGKVTHQKLDGIFIPSSQVGSLEWSMVLTYLDEGLWPLGIPRTIMQKLKMPSDHRPVGVIIKIK